MPAASPADRAAPPPAGGPISGAPRRVHPIAPVDRLRAAGVAGICSPPGGTRCAATRLRNYSSRSAARGLRVGPPRRAEEEDGDGRRMESGEGRRDGAAGRGERRDRGEPRGAGSLR